MSIQQSEATSSSVPIFSSERNEEPIIPTGLFRNAVNKCPICFEDIDNDAAAIHLHKGEVMPDGKEKIEHIFHRACLQKWFNTYPIDNRFGHPDTCPLCRCPVPQELYFQPPRAVHFQPPHPFSEAEEHRGIRLFSYILNAIKDNRLDLITHRLPDRGFTNERRGAAVRYAVQYNRPEILNYLLHEGVISNENLVLAIKAAIENNQPANVKLLLQRGPISEADRVEMMRLAIHNPEIANLFIGS